MPLDKTLDLTGYQIVCGQCGQDDCTEQFSGPCAGYKGAEAYFRAMGWKKQIDIGWICPDCAEKKR